MILTFKRLAWMVLSGVIIAFLFGILLVFLISCEYSTNNPTIVYRHDLHVKVDGKSFYGFGVVPRRASYKVEVRPRKSAERFQLTTCHRDRVYFDPDDEIEMVFKPNPRLLEHSCIVHLGSFDEKGQHQWGFFEIQGEETIKARVDCDGETDTYLGNSLCHAKAGLTQLISFKRPMSVDSVSCPLPTSDNGQDFEYQIASGFFLYLFTSESGEHHRHTTLGHTDTLSR